MQARTVSCALCLATLLTCGCSLSSHKALKWLSPNKASALTDAASTPTPNEPSSSDASGPSVERDLREFQSFPFDVALADVGGQPLSLQDYHGKVVIVDVWGTWCGPCRRVIPHLVKLQAAHPQDLQIIGLCNERTQDVRAATNSLNKSIAEFGLNYPCALIDDQTIRKVPNFGGYPTLLFIDRTGKVRLTTVGVKPESYWDAVLATLIAS